MRNYVQEGGILDLVAPSGGVTSGAGVKIGSIFAVSQFTAAAGEDFAGAVEGVFDLLAEGAGSGQAFVAGDIVYWDNTAKQATKTTTSNSKIGYAVATKATTDTTVRVRLIPVV